MSRSITTPIKSFRPQRTGNRSPCAGNMNILKPRYNSSTISYSINILEYLPPVPDPFWSLYDKDDYIWEIDALDTQSV